MKYNQIRWERKTYHWISQPLRLRGVDAKVLYYPDVNTYAITAMTMFIKGISGERFTAFELLAILKEMEPGYEV